MFIDATSWRTLYDLISVVSRAAWAVVKPNGAKYETSWPTDHDFASDAVDHDCHINQNMVKESTFDAASSTSVPKQVCGRVRTLPLHSGSVLGDTCFPY